MYTSITYRFTIMHLITGVIKWSNYGPIIGKFIITDEEDGTNYKIQCQCIHGATILPGRSGGPIRPRQLPQAMISTVYAKIFAYRYLRSEFAPYRQIQPRDMYPVPRLATLPASPDEVLQTCSTYLLSTRNVVISNFLIDHPSLRDKREY